MPKKPRENRVPIMMSEEEISAIDEWRYRNRVATRSDAVRRLVLMSLILEDRKPDIVDAVVAETESLSDFLTAIISMAEEEGITDLLKTEKRRHFARQFAEHKKNSYALVLALAPVVLPSAKMNEAGKDIKTAWDSAIEELGFLKELKSILKGGDEDSEAVFQRLEDRKKDAPE